MTTTNEMAASFRPSALHHDGPYARAYRSLFAAVAKHLPRGFFSWQPVRSYINADMFDVADDVAA